MTDKKKEALRLALEALEHEAEIGNDDAYCRERDAIREALAEPEQKPVAVTRMEDGYIKIDYLADPFPVGPLYAAPLQAQPEGCQCPACKIAPHASDCAVHNEPAYPIGKCDCGAQPAQQHIEHCLWARNGNQPCPHVQPAQQQEPVAWMKDCADFWEHYTYISEASQENYKAEAQMWVEKLRKSPQPSKPWVGLTKAEIDYQAKKDDHAIYFALGALWAEAKLREKNA